MKQGIIRFILIVMAYLVYALPTWMIWNLYFPVHASYMQCVAVYAILDLLREGVERARQIQEEY